MSALALTEVSAPPADDDGAARRRGSSFCGADPSPATTRRRTTVGSARAAGLLHGHGHDADLGALYDNRKRPSSYSGPPSVASAGHGDRFSARFSLSAFVKPSTTAMPAATVAALPAGPLGVAFKADAWPPTVARVDAALNAALKGRLKPGDVVTLLQVREDDGRVVETDCADLTGDQLELILAADDPSPHRSIHVAPGGQAR